MTDIPNRVYLAGPMSGIAAYNFPLFFEITKLLRDQGYDVFNPAENDDGGEIQSRAYYMRIDIPALMATEAVVVLPGWQESRGASLEVWLALDLDMPVYRYEITDGGIKLHRMSDFEHFRLPWRDCEKLR